MNGADNYGAKAKVQPLSLLFRVDSGAVARSFPRYEQSG
jgi:hypothetical protein